MQANYACIAGKYKHQQLPCIFESKGHRRRREDGRRVNMSIQAYLVKVDVAVVVVVHVLEPRQVVVRQSWVRPLVFVHVLVELPTRRRRRPNKHESIQN